jgi:4-nitrophenyl phosphatase
MPECICLPAFFKEEKRMNSVQLKNIKGLIIDMDGVLWRDNSPIGNLVALFEGIKALGLKFILATNNASRTVEEYHAKLNSFDVTLEEWQVINVAQATGIFLKDKYPEGVRAYVVGQPSLKKTLESYGVELVDESHPNIDVVVASIDFEVNYQKLKHASLLIQAGAEFIGTNPDVTFPTPEGFIPGSGTVIGAIEIASGTKAKMIGKPHPLLYEMALKRLSLAPDEVLAVGDRLETDIAGAQAAGIHTAQVLTGVSTRSQGEAFRPVPEIIIDNFSELIESWTK